MRPRNKIPDLQVFGIIIEFSSVWFVNTLTFTITLFMFAFESIGLMWRWARMAGFIFYVISVLIIPGYFLIHVIKAFVDFREQNLGVFRIVGAIIVIGMVITIFSYFFKKRQP
jgi:hypothetical protein